MKRSAFHILFFISFAAVVIFGSCGGHDGEYRRALLRAETLRDSMPDSALAIIQSVPFDSIHSPHLRALYTLVKTEAKYKLYIEEPADSLLEIAAEEFRAENDRPRLMRALFQLCLSPIEQGEYSRGLALCLESMSIAESLKDKEYIAHTNDIAGIIQATIYNFRESMQMERKAAALYKELGKKKNELFSTINYAQNLYNIGRSPEAIAMMDSLMPTIDPSDTGMIIYAAEAKVSPCILIGDIAGARSADSIIRRYSSPKFPADPFWSITVMIHDNDLKNARKMIDELSPTLPDLDRFHLELDYYKAVGDTIRSALYASKLRSLENDTLFKVVNNGIDVNSIATEIFKDKIQATSRQVKTDRYILLVVIIVFILIAAIIIFIFVRVQKQAKIRHDNVISNLIKEQRELTSSNSDLKKTMFGKQFTILNSLCKDYYGKKDASEEVRATLLKDIERLIHSLGNKTYFQELESSLNETHDGLVEKLYETLTDLKNTDKQLLVYTMAGISAKAICAICNLKDVAQYYNRRQVLKNKIQKSESPYKDLLLEHLS